MWYLEVSLSPINVLPLNLEDIFCLAFFSRDCILKTASYFDQVNFFRQPFYFQGFNGENNVMRG